MDSNILSHSDVSSINSGTPPNDLEKMHFKLNQAGSILSILSDWAPENHGLFTLEGGEKMMWTFSLLLDLVEEVKRLLPEA